MKRLTLTTLILLSGASLSALPVGNPADASLLSQGVFWCRPLEVCEEDFVSLSDAFSRGFILSDSADLCERHFYDWFSFRVGFYGDYVFNRNLELVSSPHEDITRTEIDTNAGYLALNILERVDLFTTLGATRISLQTSLKPFSLLPANDLFQFLVAGNANFSWSVGARATLWNWGCTLIGIEGQYFSSNPSIKKIYVNYADALYPENLHMHYHEWQVGIGITQKISIFAPYVALKWSGCNLEFENAPFFTNILGATLFNLQNSKSIGWAIGTSLIECELISLAVEGRFGDEKALYVNGQLRF